MKIDAIVYTSNTGYTREHATLLADSMSLPLYSLEEAKGTLAQKSSVIYLGWVMASSIQGYAKAAKLYNIPVTVGVCLGTTGSLTEEITKINKLPSDTKLFTLQGGFDMSKLHGVYKLIMKIVKKALLKEINNKEIKSDDDLKIAHMLTDGGSAVDPADHADIIKYINENRSKKHNLTV